MFRLETVDGRRFRDCFIMQNNFLTENFLFRGKSLDRE